MKKRMKYIVILGPDGCGKTSIADGLGNLIQGNVISKQFSFNILPSISEILSGKKRENLLEGQKNSGMVEPVNFFKGALLAIWYGIDHILGRFYLKRRRNITVIFARSYHDFLYQRSFRNVPRILIQFFLLAGPKPDLLLIPSRPAADIHKVKPELTVNEINAQYERIYQAYNGNKNFKIIDASKGIESTIDNVSRCLIG